MRVEDLDFPFPEELIAQRPVEPRDACRLLVVDPGAGAVQHRRFRDLPDLLTPGDVLVLNRSKVLSARLLTTKATGGSVELLFLRPIAGADTPGDAEPASWEALARPSRRLRPGMRLTARGGETLVLQAALGEGRWAVATDDGLPVEALLERDGTLPLPPYIHEIPADPGDYQTVYAREPGSAAAPTAGLHFTPELLAELHRRGVETVEVVLHVGLDTFRPISAARVEEHALHSERFTVGSPELERLDRARVDGRRLVAVGTTAVRVLETLYAQAETGRPHTAPREGATRLFITPGYRFRAVDVLLTNFHLPRTSLLALVMAFAGVETTRAAYAAAVAERYRFFSFGDAMLVAGRSVRPGPSLEVSSGTSP